MKKMFLAAVIGASVLFTACGDDSSSASNSPTCTINKGSQVTITKDGQTEEIVYALDGDNLVMTKDGESETTPAGGMTLDDIGDMADEMCYDFMTGAMDSKDDIPDKDDTQED